jgi:RNA recognition motif-containing protein
MTKVFVGNLHFQITDQALAEAFQDFKVKNGVVITRGRRSLGYGFVEFDSAELALEAIKSKNNTLINGRPVKVELASDNPPVRSPSAFNNSERQTWNPPTTTATLGDNPVNNAGAQPGGGPPGNRMNRRKRNPNRRRNRRGPPGSNNPSSGPASSPNVGDMPNNNRENNEQKNPGSGGGSGAPRRNGPPRGGGGGPGGSGQGGGGQGGRRRSQNMNNEDRVLSKTAVFVANLPFSVKDEDLKAFFKDNNAKTAHVVVTRNNRSRGYGFVDFEHEKDQKEAIQTKNNTKFVSGNTDRVITVTPSYKTQEVAPEN